VISINCIDIGTWMKKGERSNKLLGIWNLIDRCQDYVPKWESLRRCVCDII